MKGRRNEFDIMTKNGGHRVKFAPSGMKYSLYVDGIFRETFAPSNVIARLFGDLGDYEFDLGGSEIVMAMRFGRLKVAVDGVYIEDGKEFKPVLPSPVWSSVFVGLALLPPVLFKSTAFDYIAAACCAYICTHYIIKNPDFDIPQKRRVVYSVIVVAFSWALFAAFWYFENVA